MQFLNAKWYIQQLLFPKGLTFSMTEQNLYMFRLYSCLFITEHENSKQELGNILIWLNTTIEREHVRARKCVCVRPQKILF
jgi:hypothetical protein